MLFKCVLAAILCAILAGLLVPAHAREEAVQPEAAPPARSPATLAVTARHDRLSGGYGDWRDLTLRGSARLGEHVVQAELSSQRHFRTRGTFAGIGGTWVFSPDWYASLAIGAGDGAFFLPRYRVDAFLNKKWLAKKNLVTWVGAGRYRAPDGHVDRSTSLGAIVYFDIPLVVEGGLRRNTSDPGSVSSRQYHLAASAGRHGERLLVARHGWGTEGYLPIAPGSSLVGYPSKETTLSWRQWTGRRTGVEVGLQRYENRLYRRHGVAFTVFHDF